MCVCVCGVVTQCVEVRGLVSVSSFFYHVGPGDAYLGSISIHWAISLTPKLSFLRHLNTDSIVSWSASGGFASTTMKSDIALGRGRTHRRPNLGEFAFWMEETVTIWVNIQDISGRSQFWSKCTDVMWQQLLGMEGKGLSSHRKLVYFSSKKPNNLHHIREWGGQKERTPYQQNSQWWLSFPNDSSPSWIPLRPWEPVIRQECQQTLGGGGSQAQRAFQRGGHTGLSAGGGCISTWRSEVQRAGAWEGAPP